jgi:hypothetical protein
VALRFEMVTQPLRRRLLRHLTAGERRGETRPVEDEASLDYCDLHVLLAAVMPVRLERIKAAAEADESRLDGARARRN